MIFKSSASVRGVPLADGGSMADALFNNCMVVFSGGNCVDPQV